MHARHFVYKKRIKVVVQFAVVAVPEGRLKALLTHIQSVCAALTMANNGC